MRKRAWIGGILLYLIPALLMYVLAGPARDTDHYQDKDDTTEPAPPAGQTYIGTKVCSSCHFEQFAIWRQDKHAKAFEILPEKYRADASCLKCHTTGYGEETGYKTAVDSHLAGTSCEACHGPGSQHQEICQQFATSTTLTADQEKAARDSIYRVHPDNACITCHTKKAHKPHPEFDK